MVVITSASSGLGEATARHLSAKGASHALGARRLDRLETIAAELRKAGGKIEVLAADVTRHADLKAPFDRAVSACGRVDVVVNNAGLMAIAPRSDLRVDEWERDRKVKPIRLAWLHSGQPLDNAKGSAARRP